MNKHLELTPKDISELVIGILLIVVLMGTCTLCETFMGICTNYTGMAVDGKGNLYIGKLDGGIIQVYRADGEWERSFSIGTNRGYKFTITAKDELFAEMSGVLYKMDLYGNIIEVIETPNRQDNPIENSDPWTFVTADGTKYIKKNMLFRIFVYRVEENREYLMYKMPAIEYGIRLMRIGTSIFSFFFILRQVKKGIIKPVSP